MNNLKFLFGMSLLVIVLCVISCEKDTVPMNFIPEMSTAKVDETTITRVQAMVGGNIVQGTSIIDEQGILYSTASSEYFTDTAKVTSLDSDGNFTVLLQGLEPGKTYYYCTYVKSGPTLARANVETFTTNENPETGIAVTGQVDTYGITYAVVGGSVNLDFLPAGTGNPEIGVEYSYVASDGTTKSLQKQIEGLTDNAFTVELSNLSPAIECKYRSYVRYGGIVYYGEYRTFTTKSLVNITIPGEATDITLNSAEVTSNVDTDKLDGKDALTVGIAYSTSASALHPDSIFSSETLPVNDAVNGVFTVTLSNLSEMTAYYYASFTETDGVYCFSEIKTFTTHSEKDLAITGQVKSYGMTYAEINGSVNKDLLPDSYEILEAGIELCKMSSDGISSTYQEKSNSFENDAFIVEVNNLSPATEYKYRSFVKSGARIYYGEYSAFTTNSLINVTTLGEITEITYKSAKVTLNIQTDLFDSKENLVVGVAYSNSSTSLKQDGIFNSEKLSVQTVTDGKVNIILSDLSEKTLYYYVSFTEVNGIYCFSEIKEFNTEEFYYEAVDLGLSVKWAACNVGTTYPEGYGGYYAWGEVDEKEDYSWSSYKWCDGSHNAITKYYETWSSPNYVGTLYIDDDVAYMKWGGSWRMPTADEMNELLNECTWKWTVLNNVNGYIILGPNGKSIFLPAAGYRKGLNSVDCGYNCYYWSATMFDMGNNGGWGLIPDSDNLWVHGVERCNGLPVRPVMDK